MKIKNLHIQNLRGIRNLFIDIDEDSPIVFLGENGSGKTTLLLGLGRNSSDEKNAVGVISRIIQDLLENTTIPSNGTKINIEYMIGEIYGEQKPVKEKSALELLYEIKSKLYLVDNREYLKTLKTKS